MTLIEIIKIYLKKDRHLLPKINNINYLKRPKIIKTKITRMSPKSFRNLLESLIISIIYNKNTKSIINFNER